MKQLKRDKISYLSPAWNKAQISAGFTTRNGGVSRAPWNSLNLGLNSGDMAVHVEGNRTSFTRAFGLHPWQLLTVRQVHGQDLLLIDEENPDLSHFQNVKADAIITNQTGILVAVLVADCVPILLFDSNKRVAAAVHAGWRGAASGIIGKTIAAMAANFSCAAEDIQAAVGPAIGADTYEVDRPVRDAFRDGTGNWKLIAKESRLAHWFLDLPKSCHLQLAEAGLLEKNIEVLDKSTDGSKELFFSHRRDQGTTGRQAGFFLLGDQGK